MYAKDFVRTHTFSGLPFYWIAHVPIRAEPNGFAEKVKFITTRIWRKLR